ncbi:MAG: TatD family hydrolase [Candidatus Aenigmarchaeota archaeon]|nr:TatD family hydrolase [Candidatus Aenigmarchaeota archaeon]
MKYIDVHCHLNHKQFANDLGAVMDRARKAGVVRIICAGVNPPTNREVLELAKKNPDIVRCSLGAYPIDALNIQIFSPDEIGLSAAKNFDLHDELEFIKKNKDLIVAVGEAGLDYKWDEPKKMIEQQKKNFIKVIELCEQIKKPLIVHSRRAEADCIELLESSKLKAVDLHCFEGNKKLIKKAVELGYCFSIPPVIRKLQHFETLVQEAPITQLLTETDSPWLSGITGERNEPANVVLTVKRIASLKEFTEEETANSILLNYKKLFND